MIEMKRIKENVLNWQPKNTGAGTIRWVDALMGNCVGEFDNTD